MNRDALTAPHPLITNLIGMVGSSCEHFPLGSLSGTSRCHHTRLPHSWQLFPALPRCFHQLYDYNITYIRQVCVKVTQYPVIVMPYDDLNIFTTFGCLLFINWYRCWFGTAILGLTMSKIFGLERRSWKFLVSEILVWNGDRGNSWCGMPIGLGFGTVGHKFWFGLVTNFGLGLVLLWSQILVWDMCFLTNVDS